MRHQALPFMAVLLGVVWGSHTADAQANRLTVGEAVRLSLEHHPRLGVAHAARAAATAAFGEAKSSRIPSARAQASLTRFQEPMIVAPLHRFDVTSPPQFDPALIQSRLTIAYTLFDGGRRGARVGRARAAAASAGSEMTSVHMAVIEEVTTAYLSALTTSGIDGANRSTVAALEAQRRRTQQLLTEGRAARVELLRVDAALAQARAERIASHAESDLALRTLARLIGWDTDSIAAAGLVGVTLVGRSMEPSLNERAKRANPDLETARHRAAAEHAAARAARSEWFPTVQLSAGYVTFGSGSGNFAAEWQGGVAVSYPLFTGGARRSRNAQASARAERADAEVRLAELQIDAAVDRAVAQLRDSEGRVTALALAVDHLSEVARIEQLALATGAGVQADYITAEAGLATARANLIRARYAVIGARVGLARILGDLSLEWLADHMEEGP